MPSAALAAMMSDARQQESRANRRLAIALADRDIRKGEIMRNKILLAVASAALLASITAEGRPLALADYLNWEQVANPQVSPDGERILYTRSRVNKVKDTLDNEIWQMDADGERNRFLLKGAGASWSPSTAAASAPPRPQVL